MSNRNVTERFWPKVRKSAGCWEWIAVKDSKGYGCFWRNYVMQSAHRVAYELTKGAIPEGLDIDHLCMNRACVNPEHLEAVTHHVNIRRSPDTIPSLNAAKTHCPKGHEYTEANTQFENGRRRCATCRRAENRDRSARRRSRARSAA